MKFKIVLVGIVLAGIALIGYIKSRPTVQPYMATNVTSADTSVHQTPEEVAIIKDAETCLQKLATRSTTANRLLAFYREHAMQSHIQADGRIVSSEASRSRNWFAVACVLSEHKPSADEPAVVDASFITADRVMILSRSTRNPICRGTIFAHELSHAEDAVLHNEPVSDPLSPTWLAGELNAHGATMTILNEYTRGAWHTAVVAGDAARTELKRKMGRRSDAYIISPIDGDSTRIVRALGPLSTEDLDALAIQYLVDVNMMVVRRESAKGDSTEFMGRSIDMLTGLYGEHAPKNLGMKR